MREAWSISPGFGQKLTFIGHQLQRMLQHRNIGAGFMRIFAQVATPLASAGDPLKQPQHMAGDLMQPSALRQMRLQEKNIWISPRLNKSERLDVR